jgi:fumarylpyruvate hydrolase
MTRVSIPALEPVTLPIVDGTGMFPVRRIYLVGRNYLEHVREMNEGADERDPPFFFQKPRDAIVPDAATVPYPSATQSLHYELELVAALGVGGRNIATARALDHVFGYGIGIDLTRRDLQTIAKDKGWPWEMGKSFDHSAPCGPIYPAEDVGHADRVISLKVNGAVRQNSTTAKMTWSVAEIISKLSEQYELAPGDIVYTGTPEGVGAVVPGDRLEGEIEGLGTLTISIGPSKA